MENVSFKSYVKSLRARITGDVPGESGTDTAFVIALMALAINTLMIIRLVLDFVFGRGDDQKVSASETVDHFLIIAVVTITYFFMFNKIRQLRDRKNTLSDENEELKSKVDQLPQVIGHVHAFNHIIRDCIELIDIGFQQEKEDQSSKQDITLMDIRSRTSEHLHLALTEVAGAFETMTNGQCAVALKSVGVRDSKRVIVTVARDKKTQIDRQDYDQIAREHNCDHFDKNPQYEQLFSSKKPWSMKFDSMDDTKRRGLGATSDAVWALYDSGYCPQSQIYCAAAQDKTLIPHYERFNEDGAKVLFLTNGVLYIDSEYQNAFSDEHLELAHAFADALFKVSEYRLKFMISNKAAQKKKVKPESL